MIETWKENPFTASIFTDIALLCPSLEKLDITIPRPQADLSEVEMYRSLGKFRLLGDPTIRLDRTDIKRAVAPTRAHWHREDAITPPDPSFDEFDLRIPEQAGHSGILTCYGVSFRNSEIRKMHRPNSCQADLRNRARKKRMQIHRSEGSGC